jgi:hypothetical protein
LRSITASSWRCNCADSKRSRRTALDLRIGERLEPYGAPHALLMQIPGVDWVVAAVLIAEIGGQLSQG